MLMNGKKKNKYRVFYIQQIVTIINKDRFVQSWFMPRTAFYEQRTLSNTLSRTPSLTLPLEGGGQGEGGGT